MLMPWAPWGHPLVLACQFVIGFGGFVREFFLEQIRKSYCKAKNKDEEGCMGLVL
jgi:hypothetical protein